MIIGWEGDGWLPVHNFREIVRNWHDTCPDHRSNLNRTLSRINADFGDNPWISIFGIGRLDLSDASAYKVVLGTELSGEIITKESKSKQKLGHRGNRNREAVQVCGNAGRARQV
jgi:hypothetical protein